MKDFPKAMLEPYSISVAGAARFLRDQYELDPETVLATLERQAAAINGSVEYVLQPSQLTRPASSTSCKHVGHSKQ
jgi:hypothetical protein